MMRRRVVLALSVGLVIVIGCSAEGLEPDDDNVEQIEESDRGLTAGEAREGEEGDGEAKQGPQPEPWRRQASDRQGPQPDPWQLGTSVKPPSGSTTRDD